LHSIFAVSSFHTVQLTASCCLELLSLVVMTLQLHEDVFQEHRLTLQSLKYTAKKLQICPLTIDIGLRFIYRTAEVCRNDVPLELDVLYMAALFLASKANERLLRLRDIINTYSVYSGKKELITGEKVSYDAGKLRNLSCCHC
jgi:hypothetical protein